MALDLGELYGTIGLEDLPFQRGLDRAADAIGRFGPKAAGIAAGAGLAIASALGLSIVQGMNMEPANDKLAAQLGLTQAESKRIGGVAGRLYADAYGDSLEDVNDAVGAVMTSIEGMADASDAELETATARVLDFASAFEVDVARATQIVGQMLKTGLAGDANEAFDLLVAGSQRVPAALREDLLDAVDEYGQFFSTLGYSGEEAFAVLVEGAEKGMYGIDKAGDAIKEFTIRATDMSESSKGAYASIGLDAETMTNKLLAGGDSAAQATQQIIDGLLGIDDPASQAQAAIALFGTPLEDLNTAEIPQFLSTLSSGSDAMEGFGGAAERMGSTLNDNAVTSLTSLKRQAQMAFVGLGNWALPALNNTAAAAAENFGPALSAAGDAAAWLFARGQEVFGFLTANQTVLWVIGSIIMIALIPALIAWGVQATIAAAKNIAAWVTSAAGAAAGAALHVVSLTLLGGRWIWAGVQAMLGAARMAAAWLLALGPIGIVIAAVVGVAVLIAKNWDKIVAATRAAWNWVKSIVASTWTSVSGAVSRGISNVVGFVRGLPGKIKGAISGAKDWLVGAGKDVMRGLRDGIEAGFEWVRGKLQGVGRLIPGWLKKVLGISSPSKVMRDQVGFWIPAGVADGIDAGAPLIQASMDRAVAGLSVPKVDMATPGVNPFGAPGMDGVAAGRSITIPVYPAPGMSEQQIGEAAANKLLFAIENG